MKFLIASLAICICIGMAQGVQWTGVKLTHEVFTSMPMTARDAEAQGFTKRSGCDTGAIGERYILGEDQSTVLIYNLAGEISGIATHVPKENVQSGDFPLGNQTIAFDLEGDNFVLSAYFTEPDLICEPGSSSTFNRLIIKSKLFRVEAPQKQSQLAGGPLTEGQCVPGMGKHYWAGFQKPMDNVLPKYDLMPGFVLYNGGELVGFGFALIGDSKWMGTSPRYEHPTLPVLPFFMKDPPAFFEEPTMAPIATIHVYFTEDPSANKC